MDIREGNILWSIDDECSAVKYDEWAFYRKHFTGCAGGCKAVDLLVHSGGGVLWLVEAKDYRRNRREREKGPLDEEIATKARDTLAGILAASVNATEDERSFAKVARTASTIRIVLHLEQPSSPSKLFPRAFDPADVQQKLRQSVRSIDPHALVVDTRNRATVPWTTKWMPPPRKKIPKR